MSNGILSQEEIDALMNTKPEHPFTTMELDALAEISNIAMGSAATVLSELINRRVEITAPQVELTRTRALEQESEQFLFITVRFTSGFSGSSVMMLTQDDGGIIVDLLMGGDGQSPPRSLTEIHLSAVAEVMNQMMGSASTALSAMLNCEVRVSPPNIALESQEGLQAAFPDAEDQVVKICFKLKVDGLRDSKFIQVMPLNVAREMLNSKLGQVQRSLGGSQAASNELKLELNIGPKQPKSEPALGSVQVRPVQFAPLQPGQATGENTNLNLILDVPIVVSVQLGKTQKTIKEILEFAPGSIIELDKLAGESVDLIANGKLLAKGEVVVINENFGVRITEIEGPLHKRLSN